MQFNSLIFLFLFLPVFLLIYYILNPKRQNVYLIIAGLFFYSWGQKEAVFILFFLIVINYYLSIRISSATKKKNAKMVYIVAILLNLIVLVFYKYLAFFLKIIGIDFSIEGLPYPTGISFMTFLAISYLTDVYRESEKIKINFSSYALYISFFPKLITGPIAIFNSFEKQLHKRDIKPEDISIGVKRFIIGLGKKVLIADMFAKVSDKIFLIPSDRMGTPISWIGVVAYTFQIYYDFSGYSDMAIGLGRMIGFKIPENFNYPYAADSIKEFWNRWHITLGHWLKIYLFFPIAYSVMRRTKKDRIFGMKIENLAYLTGINVTFAICGLWHGANLTFVVWGLYYGVLLSLEHMGIRKMFKKRFPIFVRIAVTQFLVIIGWVLFRSEDLQYSYHYLRSMFGLGGVDNIEIGMENFLNNEFLFVMIIGVIGVFPVIPKLKRISEKISVDLVKSKNSLSAFFKYCLLFTDNVFYSVVFVFGIMAMNVENYRPFIYFNF